MQEFAATPEIGAETQQLDALSLANDFSSISLSNSDTSTYVAPGRPVPAPTVENQTPRSGRRQTTTTGNNRRSKRARRSQPPCCSCTRSSTCGRAPTAKQAGCSCYASGKPCTNCDCGERCMNRSHITKATGLLGNYLVQKDRTITIPSTSTGTLEPAALDSGPTMC